MKGISNRWLFNCFLIKTKTKTKTSVVVPFSIKNMSTGHQESGINNYRLVAKKFLAQPQNEGDGAFVRRSLGSMELRRFDPFLLLDDFSITPPAGFPDHPHRGFETVTYMLEGAVTHQDFAGHEGTIRTGDLQWMTAGRGIVHSEMPAGVGPNRGLQLWINLSSKDKMIEPRYQELLNEEIKRAEIDGVNVKIIAGESFGVKSPVFTRTPAMFLDVIMKPGAEWHQSIPEAWNSFVYVIEGEGCFGSLKSSPVAAHHLLLLGPGDGLGVWNKCAESLRFVLIGGQPLNEPVVQYGPFVMNTQSEIQRTFDDYRLHRNGFEKASKKFKNVDPFILFDEFTVSTPGGFTDHPHKGNFDPSRFVGHKGTIRTGDVQWMTAGRGVVHSEMPGGGTNKGLQLWVNLSSKDKMVEPAYQDLPKENMKRAEKDGVEVRVIAGEAMVVQSLVFTRTATMYLDFILTPEAKWYQSIPTSWNSFVYVVEGEGVFGTLGSASVSAHHILVLGPGDGVYGTNLLSLSGSS